MLLCYQRFDRRAHGLCHVLHGIVGEGKSEAPGLDPGEIEHGIDQAKEVLTALLHTRQDVASVLRDGAVLGIVLSPSVRCAGARASMKIRFGTLLSADIQIEIGGKIWGCIDLDTPQSGHQTPWLRRSFGLDELLD